MSSFFRHKTASQTNATFSKGKHYACMPDYLKISTDGRERNLQIYQRFLDNEKANEFNVYRKEKKKFFVKHSKFSRTYFFLYNLRKQNIQTQTIIRK